MSVPRIRLVEPSQQRLAPTGKRPLGRMLVERGFIKASDLLAILDQQRVSDAQLGHLLLSQNLVSEHALFETLALQRDVPFLKKASALPDLNLQTGFAPHECLRLQCVPWARVNGTTLLATSAPDHFDEALTLVPAHLHPVTQVIVSSSEIIETIRHGSDTLLAARAETLVPDDLSCRALPAQLKTLLCVLLPLLAIAAAFHVLTLAGIYHATFTVAVTMVFIGMLIKTCAALLRLIPKPEAIIDTIEPKLPRISILIPLHDEPRILTTLLQRIGKLAYPKALLDVILVVETGDAPTRQQLEREDLPNWMRVLAVPAGNITTKPRAMNYALPFCKGEIIGIYDAEDAPHPQQLNEIAKMFAREPEKTACIQAVLDFYNARSNPLSRFFAIEYATWFRMILPGIARLGFPVPLGGTSVFFRRKTLDLLHGWDAHNVTEDADLGIRLARAGYETKLISSVTYEEANNKTWPWIKQRSRWLKGYLITYFTHMRRPMRLLFELGAWKFLGFQTFFLSSICQYMLAPLIWSSMLLYWGAPDWMRSAFSPTFLNTLMITFIIMWCMSTAVYIAAVCDKEHRHLIPWTLLMSLYMALGTLAIYKGAWELISKPFYWEKTAHGQCEDAFDHAPSEDAESSFSLVTKATEM